MKTYHLYDTAGETPTRLKKHPNPNSGLPTKWELPDGSIPPTLEEGMAYIVQDLTILSYDPETQIVETKVTLEKNSKVVRDLTDEEIAARNATPLSFEISAWQAQAALKLTPYGDGGVTLYDAVVAALDAIEDPVTKIVAQTAFEKDAKFVKTSPTIAMIAAGLSLTQTQIDDLFELGASLEV